MTSEKFITQVTSSSYDAVGPYNQDVINGFPDHLIDRFLELADLSTANDILEAMSGNGNLSERLLRTCRLWRKTFPNVTLLDSSRMQCNQARKNLTHTPTKIIWGDATSMTDWESKEQIPDEFFDRILIKSGNHEIPLEKQQQLYQNIFRVLKPNGLFVNLGFLFDEKEERDEFRQVARVKDSLAGMSAAAVNRHFLTRGEFYSLLEETGFSQIRCGSHFEYRISSLSVLEQYFPGRDIQNIDREMQARQAQALAMRRYGHLHFERDTTLMICPGEITVVRKPAKPQKRSYSSPAQMVFEPQEEQQIAGIFQQVAGFIPQGSKVLDLACSNGCLAEWLLDKQLIYTGLDNHSETLELCRKRFASLKNFTFKVFADFLQAADTGQFDCVTLLNPKRLNNHNIVELLHRAFQFLRPKGTLILQHITLPNTSWNGKLLSNHFQANLNSIEKTNGHMVKDNVSWSKEGICELLLSIGFQDIQLINSQCFYPAAFLLMAKKGNFIE